MGDPSVLKTLEPDTDTEITDLQESVGDTEYERWRYVTHVLTEGVS